MNDQTASAKSTARRPGPYISVPVDEGDGAPGAEDRVVGPEIAVAHRLGFLAQGGAGNSVVEVSNQLSGGCQLVVVQVVRRVVRHRPLDEGQQVVPVG